MAERLRLTPITVKEAARFVAAHHRHSRREPGTMLWAVACSRGDEVVGVAIVGLPTARMMMDGYTAEVRRCCTLGDQNAPSMLYAACWRAARALGYQRLITLTLEREPGTSLLAAGWRIVGRTEPQTWSRPGRPRVENQDTLGEAKIRWEAV
jgi:hypothetical protein